MDQLTTSTALRRALRIERTMIGVRWVAAAFATVQILTFYLPYPPGVLPAALGLVGLLVVANLVIIRLHRRIRSIEAARWMGVASIGVHIVAAMGLVTAYTFDPDTAMFAILYLLPLEAALRFQLRGALITMGVVTVLYTLREVYGALVFGTPFLWVSISFRMGIGLFIAFVAGRMAANLVMERNELERAKESLEESAVQLAAANAELEAANEIKDDFVAMTNHELRTPLTAILGYTAMLTRRWDVMDDERRQEALAAIAEQGTRLQELVEGLLTLSSAQAGALRVDLEEVEVRDVVDRAIRQLGPAEHDYANHCPPGLAVWAEPASLVQILVNYLTNARKYGAPPFGVSAARNADHVVIAVEDGGPGVEPDFVPRLFDKFSQASHGQSRTVGGTGLGLAIVEQLAAAQGGVAWYEPRQPQGARFCVRLGAVTLHTPARRPDPDQVSPGPPAAQ